MSSEKIQHDILELCKGDRQLAEEAMKFWESERFLLTPQEAVILAEQSRHNTQTQSRLRKKGP